MADLNALYQALRNADAAGDTEGARRLSQYIQQVQTQAAPAPEPEPEPVRKSTVGSELKRGAQQLASSMQTTYGALTGSPEEAAKAGLERGDAISQVAGEGVGFEPVKRAYQEKGLLSAAGEAVSQIPRALAGQGANLATMATGARLGAMAGSAVAPGPGTLIGGALGAGAAMLPQFFGSNVERQAAEQMEAGKPVEIDRTKAGVAAVGQSALEGAGAAFTLGKGVVKGILGIADDAAITSARAAKQLEETARRSLTGTVVRGAGRGAVVEMPVEIAQQVVERAQAGLDLTSPDALAEYGEAAYQAGLVGGPLGAAGNVVTRGQARDRVAAKAQADAAAQAEQDAASEQAAADAAAQPKLPMVVAPGTQGTLFTPEEMGRPVPAPKTFAEPVAGAVPEGQQDLGLDYQREYADMAQERERLKQGEQTPDVNARIAELSDQMALYTQSDIESIRAEAEGKAARAQEAADTAKRFPALANAPDLLTQSDEVKGRTQGELFPGEDLGTAPAAEPIAEPTLRPKRETGPTQRPLGLRRNPEGQPTTFGQPEPTITSADIMLTAIPVPKGVEGWLTKNVVGSTRTQLDALIAKDPTLVEGSTPRAKILRSLTAAEVPAFQETPRVKPTPPIAKTPAVEQRDEPRVGEPSVGVLSEPAAPVVPEPRARVPRTAATPVTPDGSGLVPAGRPAVQGDETAIGEPVAVTPAKSPKPAPVEADAPKAYEKAPAIVTLSQAKTKAQLESALDEVARIRRDPANVDHAAVNDFLTDALAAPGFEPMFTAALDRTRSRQAPTTPPATREEKPVGKAAPVRAVPSAFFEPIGVDARTGEVKRGKQMLVQPIDDKRAAEYVRAKEQADEGDTSELVALFEEIEQEGNAPDTQGALFDAEGKVTKEAKVKPQPAAPAKPRVRQETEEKAAQPEPRKPSWADEEAVGSQVVVYADDEVALIRALDRTDTPRYYGMDRSGVMVTTPIDAIKNERILTAAQQRKLRAEARKAAAEDVANAGKYPDGPFTGTSKSVIGSDSIDTKYVQYLNNLMQSLGLGNIKVFMYTDTDVQGAAGTEKYRIYGSEFPKLQKLRDREVQGAVRPLNDARNQYGMFLRPGRSESYTLETISHEMGHIIEHHLRDLADAPTRQALDAEYKAWLEKTKKMNVAEFMDSLRNREDVAAQSEMLEGPTGQRAAKDLSGFESYWASYAEWFADNVSRWATTNEKPLTITEKFFSKVAQKMRDLVALVTGRKYPPNKVVADFLNKMGPADFTPSESQSRVLTDREDFSVSVSTEALIDSMGPIDPVETSGLRNLIKGVKAQDDIGYATKFRTQTADSAATIEYRLREKFDGAVRDKLGKRNPMGLYRQAQDYSKMLLEYFQVGAISKEPATGLWKVKADSKIRPPADVYKLIDKWAAKNGYTRDRATQIASRVLEGVRLDAMRASNKAGTTNFRLHLKDAEIDQLVREYKANPDLQAMSKLMDESRIAMVDNMVAVGRLTKEQGKEWREVVGYVPFDRLDDEKFDAVFIKAKKISNKGLAQLGKLPELIGSDVRPVGNVFDNYVNTLGWMVGQTMKTDATVQTLRSLEDAGHAKFLGRNTLGKDNVVGGYVDGEMMYWEMPSKYDVLAFKDLNPPKAKWLQILGQASNVLRKAVTSLPPFALKQVTDDVQRAIMTSGVKNPGALLRMTLSNFGGMAFAELRGIQHPAIREFGALGLTGEYDFQQGKPATSLLKDLGYKPRGKFETLLHRLDGITRASDLAVRKAIYDQTMIENNNDQLLAQTRAREFINFRRRGASDFVGAMVTTIPFFNAYIQGMDVLYRAASGKDSSASVNRAQARRMFYSRAAIAMTLSTLYALGKGDDDEDYNEMDLRVRDGNWILPGGFKLPVPTELGALFKVIPERIVEYMRRQGTPEEQEAWEATRTALAYIMEQYVGRVVPVPQGVKPLLEAWTNYSFFTGRELEGIYQKQQDPSLRRASNTSELAIAISEFSRDVVGVDKISPILIDNALNGYFGSTAGLLVAVTDSLLNPTRVDRPLHKYALVSNYLYDPVGTRRKTEFYDEREKVGRANTTLRELMKTDLDRAAAYAEEHADELMMESAINSTLQQLEDTRAYRKYLNSKEAAADMTPTEREDAIKEIKQMEVEMVGWVREAKVALRQ